MKQITYFAAATIVGALVVMQAHANNPAFQASLTPEHAIYERTQRIEGVTLSIWGENPQSSFALGFVNGSTGKSSGLTLGLVNYTDEYRGVQWAFANLAYGDFYGWQGGYACNYVEGKMTGLQSGMVNLSGTMSGLQFGLINYAQKVDSGVQLGLVNIIAQNEQWFTNLPDEVAPAMIFLNWRF